MTSTPSIPRLRAVYVARWHSDLQWEQLRVVRNECADGFTHFRDEITPRRQEDYRMKYNENVRHYLYLTQSGDVVGFSRLEWRSEDGYVYPTYGVSPRFRGQGYAYEIVEHAMYAAGGPLRGDLLLGNEAIMRVDFALGWYPRGTSKAVDGVLLVEAAWPPIRRSADAVAHMIEQVREANR